MPEANLLTICGTAFLSVFALLVILAVVIQLITVAFPSCEKAEEAAVVAAISTALATIHPGARVTRIEEVT